MVTSESARSGTPSSSPPTSPSPSPTSPTPPSPSTESSPTPSSPASPRSPTVRCREAVAPACHADARTAGRGRDPRHQCDARLRGRHRPRLGHAVVRDDGLGPHQRDCVRGACHGPSVHRADWHQPRRAALELVGQLVHPQSGLVPVVRGVPAPPPRDRRRDQSRPRRALVQLPLPRDREQPGGHQPHDADAVHGGGRGVRGQLQSRRPRDRRVRDHRDGPSDGRSFDPPDRQRAVRRQRGRRHRLVDRRVRPREQPVPRVRQRGPGVRAHEHRRRRGPLAGDLVERAQAAHPRSVQREPIDHGGRELHRVGAQGRGAREDRGDGAGRERGRAQRIRRGGRLHRAEGRREASLGLRARGVPSGLQRRQASAVEQRHPGRRRPPEGRDLQRRAVPGSRAPQAGASGQRRVGPRGGGVGRLRVSALRVVPLRRRSGRDRADCHARPGVSHRATPRGHPHRCRAVRGSRQDDRARDLRRRHVDATAGQGRRDRPQLRVLVHQLRREATGQRPDAMGARAHPIHWGGVRLPRGARASQGHRRDRTAVRLPRVRRDSRAQRDTRADVVRARRLRTRRGAAGTERAELRRVHERRRRRATVGRVTVRGCFRERVRSDPHRSHGTRAQHVHRATRDAAGVRAGLGEQRVHRRAAATRGTGRQETRRSGSGDTSGAGRGGAIASGQTTA
uniref:Endo-glucanase n=1 Tax=Ruminococcus flavefaciens TaxID=1265 RepID=Q52747_RUMFL|nr:endo-glucanase [Ruminococcus flavefaciens]